MPSWGGSSRESSPTVSDVPSIGRDSRPEVAIPNEVIGAGRLAMPVRSGWRRGRQAKDGDHRTDAHLQSRPMRAAEPRWPGWPRTAFRTPRSAPGCSSARGQSSTTWVRSSPSSASADAVSSTASCPAIRIPPSFLFDRVQKLPAGLLATAAGLGAHPAVLMHPGMPFALVAAALTYRRANPKERLGNFGVVLRLAA
jgi:hypothetical protein